MPRGAAFHVLSWEELRHPLDRSGPVAAPFHECNERTASRERDGTNRGTREAARRAGPPSISLQRPAIFLERERIESVLLLEHARGQPLGVVARQDPDLRLGDDRPRIELGGDEMDRAAGIFVAGDQSARRWVSRPLCSGSRLGMDVEDPALPFGDEPGRRAAACSRPARPSRRRARAARASSRCVEFLALHALVALRPGRDAEPLGERPARAPPARSRRPGRSRSCASGSRRLYARQSASMFEPRPEIRTRDPDPLSHGGSRSSRPRALQVPAEPATVQPRAPGLDPADLEDSFSGCLQALARRLSTSSSATRSAPCRCRN